MFKWIFVMIVAAVAAFAGYVALQPSQFTVTRSAHIDAAPEKVFAQINDFHNWQNWSPWKDLDPNATTTFEGPQSGKGAVYAWSGNSEVGEGKLTILESTPNDHITMRLDFERPMQSSAENDYTLASDGNGTRMTWTMSGHNSFLERAMCVFFDMDKMLGGMFEKGMANINNVVKPKS